MNITRQLKTGKIKSTVGERVQTEKEKKGGCQTKERAILLNQLRSRFIHIPKVYETLIESANSETLLKWSKKILEAQCLDEIFQSM